MNSRETALALLAGAALGVAAVSPAFLMRPNDDDPLGAPPDRLPASAMMGVVAKRFVARSGPGTFYEAPTPYGEFLCRVRSTSFRIDAAKGRIEAKGSSQGELIDVHTYFTVWAEPESAASRGNGRETACRDWRRFDRLIIANDGWVAERGVSLLTKAVHAARDGKIDFPLTCEDTRETSDGAPCDGAALLRQVDITDDIMQIMADEDAFAGHPMENEDTIFLRPPGHKRGCGRGEEILAVTIRSAKIHWSDARPLRVEVGQTVEC